ncbi:DUF6498-containing protein [Haloarchaeobius baliensis]|uniref:DUF6498-containing protein n=1 Tax=Haloarchaeobius baliensis TaxID=1670458 RepID=UPI003F885732
MRTGSSSRLAVAALLAGNAVPLIGVLAFGWSAHSVLVVYWLESGVVGAISVLKILRAEGADDPDALPSMRFNERSLASFVGSPNRRVARFFVSHYGGFWAVHGVFVLVFAAAFPLPFASPTDVAVAAVGFVGYHAVSYWQNYVAGREFERNGPVRLMVEPYRRVLVLHVTIVLGFFAVASAGAPVGALVVMVLAKTVLDLWGHWREHDRAKAPAPVDA